MRGVQTGPDTYEWGPTKEKIIVEYGKKVLINGLMSLWAEIDLYIDGPYTWRTLGITLKKIKVREAQLWRRGMGSDPEIYVWSDAEGIIDLKKWPRKNYEKLMERIGVGQDLDLKEVQSFLKGVNYGPAGRAYSVDWTGYHGQPKSFFSIDPSNRARLDHYGNDGEGWDDSWYPDYANPTENAAQKALDRKYGKGSFSVSVGEKGHIHVYPEIKKKKVPADISKYLQPQGYKNITSAKLSPSLDKISMKWNDGINIAIRGSQQVKRLDAFLQKEFPFGPVPTPSKLAATVADRFLAKKACH